MGLANLVPGISGGTMLLAAGIYSKFIDAIANTTKLRFRFRSLLVLGTVVVAAGLAILLGAGLLKDLVVNQRWVMYSLFIGLTLGGVPMVWRLARPASVAMIVAGGLAFGGMVALAFLQSMNYVGSSQSGVVMSVIAGVAGASAMILPGLSGGYILLLLGQYVPILSAIDQFKEAIEAGDISSAMQPALTVMLPVGIGVVIGVVAVGNLVQWLLNKYRKPTLGLLLGLLIGSTVGLWPFQQGIQPEVGQTVKGSIVTNENIDEIDPEDWPTQFFAPELGQVFGALGLVVVGFGITMGVAKIGGTEDDI
jgi:putative membrane protein